jgi:diguanylate cyclase (GGDEF)-like protein
VPGLRLPRYTRLTVLVGATVALAGLVLALALTLPLRSVEWSWWGAGLLLAAVRLAEAGNVEINRDAEGDSGYGLSVSAIPQIASAVLLPPSVAALLAGAGMFADEARNHSPFSKLAFNVASTTLSVGVSSLVANKLGIAGAGLAEAGWQGVGAFGLVAVCYYLCNALPVGFVTAVASGRAVRPAMIESARDAAPAEFAMTVLGGLAAFVWVTNPYWLVVGASPAIISQLTLRYIAERNRKAAQLSSLDRLGRQLSTGLSVDEVFHAVSSQLRGVRSVEGCFLVLSQPPAHLSYGLADGPLERSLARDLAERVDASGQTTWLGEPVHERDSEPTQARSWLALPLGRGADRTGCLGLVSRVPNAFGDEDREFFALVAERVALALEVARRAAELRRMAFHDVLTGLPNRALFADRLEEALSRAAHRQWTVALFYLDLDNFRVVNESLGHQAGDELLVQVGSRLATCIENVDIGTHGARATIARLGGDEFVVLVDQVENEVEAEMLAERLTETLRAPIQVAGQQVVASVSIGVALTSLGRDRPEALLRSADLALYRAKANGKNGHALFDLSLETLAMQRLELERDLRLALERNEFRVHYQPLIRLETGRICGWEALVRWEHPTRGLMAPAAFIPIAEETGLIVPIGQWVLEEACRQARAWESMFPDEPPRSMSVNLSGRQFAHPRLVEDIHSALRAARLDPHHLVLEITESVVMQDAAAAVATLNELKALGIRLAIDDFGTGYSSLAYLKRFPVDVLKIDRSFIEGLGQDAQDSAIVEGVLVLARSLGLGVTAEGIETPRQQLRLEQLGCDVGQGYLFGAPRSAEITEQMLRELAPSAFERKAA